MSSSSATSAQSPQIGWIGLGNMGRFFWQAWTPLRTDRSFTDISLYLKGDGQLICVLAGAGADIERVTPYCKGVMGRENIVFADVPPSRATHLKVIGNTFVLSMVLALSEGHTLAEKSGLGTAELHKFIETLFPGPYTAYSNRLLSGDYWQRQEPLFAVDLARKDAGHARALAQKAGVQMKGLEVADGYLAGVKEHMGARGDIASIYGAKRAEAGLKFENDK